MSVTRAIDEEIREIEGRITDLESRVTRLREARRILSPEKPENGAMKTVRRSRGEWRQIAAEAAASLGKFTVAELAQEVGAENPSGGSSGSLYRAVSDLVEEGTLREVKGETGSRNASIYEVVGARADVA